MKIKTHMCWVSKNNKRARLAHFAICYGVSVPATLGFMVYGGSLSSFAAKVADMTARLGRH